jgi:hypothetical protein
MEVSLRITLCCTLRERPVRDMDAAASQTQQKWIERIHWQTQSAQAAATGQPLFKRRLCPP